MLRSLTRLGILALLLAGAGWWYFHDSRSPGVRIAKLEEEKRALEKIVGRLTTERRVAEFVITDQPCDANGDVRATTILWEEANREGERVASKSFTIDGDEVHVDALSIRFVEDFVLKDDPLRGKGLVLFTRLYGAHQTPAQGFAIDDPDRAPGVYRAATSKEVEEASGFERQLWGDFWRLVHDKRFREEKGVQVASGKGVWVRKLDRGKVYTVTVDAHGNPTVDWEPIKPILRAAMKQAASE